MKSYRDIRTDSCSDVLQHADVAVLVTHPTAALAGPQAQHRQATHQLNTPALPLSHILPIITKYHPYTLLPSRTKGITTKVTNKIKVILEVNSKVWSCSSQKVPLRRSVVESLSTTTHLLWAHRQGKGAAMGSLDDHRRIQGQINT